MNKRTQEKLEREKLKQMIDNNPKLKDFLDAAVNETGNKDLQELIAPVLKDTFDKIMDNIIKRISLTMDNRTMTEEEELEQQNTEMRMKYWNW